MQWHRLKRSWRLWAVVFLLAVLMAVRLVVMVQRSAVPVVPRAESSIWFDQLQTPLLPDFEPSTLTRAVLDESLALGTSFLLRNQRPEGNFNYEYDFIDKRYATQDNPVRQAGTLWGLALIHLDHPSEGTLQAVRRGLAFFRQHSRDGEDGRRIILYPGSSAGQTGTAALVALALVELLRAEPDHPQREEYEQELGQIVKFLRSLGRKDGRFFGSYRQEDGQGYGAPSPYYDGETLLALVKAAKYAGHDEVREIALDSAAAMYDHYVTRALAAKPDNATTKGFFQWGLMAFFELYTAGWSGTQVYAQRGLELADWMIDVHRTLERTKNTAYAHEGLAVAWQLARLTHRLGAMSKIGIVLERGLARLTSWQVGGPRPNAFLQAHPSRDPAAVGGVMNGADDPGLRIDVTQHQVHALLLVRRFLLPPPDPQRLTRADLADLARYAGDSLLAGSASPASLSPRVKADPRPRLVALSLSDGRGRARVVWGGGRGALAAVQRALERAKAGFKQPPLWLKVDFVREAFPVQLEVARPLDAERSLFGLGFSRGTGLAFLPEELVAATLVDSQQKLRPANVAGYAQGATGVQALQAALDAGQLPAFRFSTVGFFVDRAKVTSLYRGHRRFEALDPELLLEAARQAGSYLVRAVGKDGKFVYSYLPKSDRESSDYNVLRHAGAVFSMLQLYELTRDPSLWSAARRAVEALRKFAQPCALEGAQDPACIVEKGEVKLGGNGLALVALAQYTALSGERALVPLMRRLGEWIVASQAEDGRFSIHKQALPAGTVDEFVSSYYPGEALLGLVRLFEVDPDPRWLDAAERGAQYLINVRDRDVPLDKLNHDHWLLYALSALYRHRPDPLYLNHALHLARAIVSRQQRLPDYPDWLGSYYRPPRSTPTATRSEGLAATYPLAQSAGEARLAGLVLDSLRLGVAFQLQMQFGPESALYLKKPQRVLGGVHRDLTNFEIRIDYVQHTLSSLLGLYHALGGK